MSTSLDRFLKPQSDGPSGALTLADWNGMVAEVGSTLDELRVKAVGFDEVSRVAIEILLQRVNDVLGPAFDAVATKAALVDALYAQLNGQGVSADAVQDTANRVLVTPAQRDLIGSAAQAADLANVATLAGSIGARDLYLSGF